MKKITIPVFLLFAYLATSAVLGVVARNQTVKSLLAVNAYPGYSVEIVNQAPGLFASTFVIKVGFDMQFEGASELESAMLLPAEGLFFRTNLAHGPVYLLPKFSFGLYGLQAFPLEKTDMDSEYREKEWVNINSTMGFLGKGDLHAYFPDQSTESEEFLVSFKGGDLYATFENYGQSITASGTFREFLFKSSQIDTLSIPSLNIKSQVSLNVAQPMLSTGTFDFDVPEIEMVGSDANMTLDGLQISSRQEKDAEGLYGLCARASVERANISTLEESLNDFVWDICLNKVSEEVLLAYNEFVNKINVNDPEQNEIIAQDFFTKALESEPHLDISEISFQVDQTTYLNLSASLFANKQIAESIRQQALPITMIGDVYADLDVNLGRGILIKIEELASVQQQSSEDIDAIYEEEMNSGMLQLQPGQLTSSFAQFVEMGLVNETQHGYRTSLKLEGGALTINGQQIPLPF